MKNSLVCKTISLTKIRIFVPYKQTKTNDMKNLTLDEILNSDLMNEMIAEQDKDLSEAGWTYEEIKEVAKMVTSK